MSESNNLVQVKVDGMMLKFDDREDRLSSPSSLSSKKKKTLHLATIYEFFWLLLSQVSKLFSKP